jgi:hypothetical protein
MRADGGRLDSVALIHLEVEVASVAAATPGLALQELARGLPPPEIHVKQHFRMHLLVRESLTRVGSLC